MLQQGKPDDYVVATGETTTVRRFVEMAFERAGLPIRCAAPRGHSTASCLVLPEGHGECAARRGPGCCTEPPALVGASASGERLGRAAGRAWHSRCGAWRLHVRRNPQPPARLVARRRGRRPLPPRRRRWEGEHGSVAEVGKVAGGERAGETVVRIDPKYFRPAEARRPAPAGLRPAGAHQNKGAWACAVAVDKACARPALECSAGISACACVMCEACAGPALECSTGPPPVRSM